MPGPPPLLYKDVKDIYARAQSQNPEMFGQQSLADFSKFMQANQSDANYSAGLGGESYLKNANLWLDKYIGPESTVGHGFGEMGTWSAEKLGVNPKPVEEVFAGTPRMIADFLPYRLPYVGPALTALMAGSRAYTETDDPWQGALQGGIAALIPQAGAAARFGGAKLLNEGLTSKPVQTYLGEMLASKGGLGTKVAERATEYLSEMTGITAANKAIGVGTDLATGQDWTRHFTPEAFTGDIASAAVFAPIAGAHAVMPTKGARSYTEMQRMRENFKTKTGEYPTLEDMTRTTPNTPSPFEVATGEIGAAIATSPQGMDLQRYKSILGTLTPYGPKFGTVEERDAAMLKMESDKQADLFGQGLTPMQMYQSQNEAYRSTLQEQIAERSQALTDIQKKLATKGMSALEQAQLEAKRATHTEELLRLEKSYKDGMPTLESAAESVQPILQRTYGMNPPSPGQQAMMAARSARGLNVARGVISRADDARAARSAIGPDPNNPLAYRGLESAAGLPPSGQMGLRLDLADPLDRPLLQERTAAERVRDLQQQIAEAAHAEPGNATAIKALATVIHTDPEMAKDVQLGLFSDAWLKKQLQMRSEKEGTAPAQALEETVRGAASVVQAKVKKARAKMDKDDAKREEVAQKVERGELPTKPPVEVPTVAVAPEPEVAAKPGMKAKAATAKAEPLPHTPEKVLEGARPDETALTEAQHQADLSKLTPLEAKTYVRHSNLLNTKDAEQFQQVAQRKYDSAFFRTKDKVDLSTPEGQAHMRNVLQNELRNTRAVALKEEGGGAGLERTQLIEGRDPEGIERDHNIAKGLKEPMSEMDVSQATSSDEAAVRAEKAEKYVGQIRALIRSITPEDLSSPKNRAMADHIKRAEILFDYMSQNTDQLTGAGRDGLNIEAINDAWKAEGVGYANKKNVSKFMTPGGVFRDIMKQVGDNIGVKFMGVDSNGMALAGAVLRAIKAEGQHPAVRYGFGRGGTEMSSRVSAMLTAAELSDAMLRTGKYTPEQARYYGEFVYNMANLFPVLAQGGTKWTTLINDLKGGVMGMHIPFSSKHKEMFDVIALSHELIVHDRSEFATTMFNTGTVIGHEAWHGIVNLDRENPKVQRAFKLIDGFEPQEQLDMLNSVFQDLADSIGMKVKDRLEFASQLNHSVNENPTGEGTLGSLAGMLTMHMALPDSARGPSRLVANLIQYLPQPVADLMFSFVSRMRDIVQTLSGTFGAGDKIPKAIKELQGIFRDLAADRARLDSARVEVENMQNLDPARFWMNVAEGGIAPIAESERVKGSLMKAAVQDLDGEKIGMFSKAFENFSSQKERYPILDGPWDSVLNYREVVNTASQLGHTMLADNAAGGKFDFKTVAKNVQDKKYVAAFSKLALDLKDNRDKGTPLLDPAKPEHNRSVYEKYGSDMGLTGDKLQHFVDFNDRATKLGVMHGEQWVQDSIDANAHGVQRILTLDGMEYKEAYANARRLVTAIDQGDNGAILALRANIPEVSFNRAIEFASQTQALVEQTRSIVENNFGYRTEMRLGDFFVHWKAKDGRNGGLGFPTKSEATAYAEKVAGEGASNVQVGEKTQFNEITAGINKDVINKVSQIEMARNATLAKMLPEGVEMPVEPYSIAGALQAEMMKSSTAPMFRPSKAAPGREELNMIDGLFHLARTLPNVFGARQLRRQQAAMMDDKTFKANPDLLARGKQMITNELTPDGPIARAVRQFAFTWLMGGNISSVAINSLESFQRVPTLLIKDGHSLLNSYGFFTKGMKTAIGYVVPGLRGALRPTEEHVDLIKHLEARGFVHGNIFDLAHTNTELQFINMRLAAQGKNPIEKAVDLAKYPVMQLNNMFRAFMTGSEKLGQITAGIAGYEAAKKANPSASRGKLFAEAERIAGLGTSIGGKANRPDLLSRIPGIAGILTMQNYQLGVLGMVGRLIKDSVKRGDQTPAEHAASVKSLVHFTASTVATAGVMGLPLAGASIAILEAMFPNLQINANIRQVAAKIFDDDADTGHVVSGMVLKGGLSTMLGADVSGRLGLGGVLGLNEQNGFDVKQMLGPGLNIAKQMIDGVGLVAEGKTSEGVTKLLPNAVGNFIRAYQQGGMATTQDGKAITPLTGYEQVMRGIGFRPKALADAQDALNMEAKANKVYATEHSVQVKQLADEFQAGNYDAVRQGAEALFAHDQTHLPTETMKEVVGTVMDRVIPADPLRTAKRATDIVKTFPSTRGQISEEARAQMQMEMLGMLGLQGRAPGLREMMIDSIRQSAAQGGDPMSLFEAGLSQRSMQGKRSY